MKKAGKKMQSIILEEGSCQGGFLFGCVCMPSVRSVPNPQPVLGTSAVIVHEAFPSKMDCD